MTEGDSSAEASPEPLILVVDDDPTITAAVSRIVRRLGHRVIAVNDPHEALELIGEQDFDLVITDKDMPQMSGHVLLDILKDRHPDVPSIMLTGVPSLESALVAINSDQVIRYLTKPWNPGDLEETIAIGLNRRVALREAAATRRAEAQRAAVLEALYTRDPELRTLAAGELTLVSSPISDFLDERVRRHLESETASPLALGSLPEVLRAARPAEIAEAMAILPLRNPTVGLILSATPEHSRLSADLRGQMHTVLDLPAEVGDVVAARLATYAAIDPASPTERLGRMTVRLAGAAGQLVVGYQRSALGASVEVRRVMVGTDAGASTAPTQVGQYKILEVVGQGGMGTVYRAIHTILQRPAAVKLLRGVYSDDPITVARFVREARAATRAHHPRIVETYDFGHLPDGRPYLVMELVESPTLQQRLRRGPLDPLEAVHIARDIADALAAAHHADVVHRDLKPANVFVDEHNAVKLADFGAAKILEIDDDNLTRTGMTLGTPSYMSPEHITGKVLDGRTDIYALGCVLFEMLTGRPPYRGDPRSVLAQHIQAEVPAVSSPSGELPASLGRLVKKAMAKDPHHRYATAGQMVIALDQVGDEMRRARETAAE